MFKLLLTGSVCTMQRHVIWPTCVCQRSLWMFVASLALQSPGPSWCPGLGRLLASTSLLRMAPGPGTDYQWPSDHQNCSSLHSSTTPLVCSSTRQCWLQLRVSCTIVWRCCDCTASSAPTTNVQTWLKLEPLCLPVVGVFTSCVIQTDLVLQNHTSYTESVTEELSK